MPQATRMTADPGHGRALPATPPTIAVVGPTATGKTALAVRLARAIGAAELVDANSRQVLRGLHVGDRTGPAPRTWRTWPCPPPGDHRPRRSVLGRRLADGSTRVPCLPGPAGGAADRRRWHGSLCARPAGWPRAGRCPAGPGPQGSSQREGRQPGGARGAGRRAPAAGSGGCRRDRPSQPSPGGAGHGDRRHARQPGGPGPAGHHPSERQDRPPGGTRASPWMVTDRARSMLTGGLLEETAAALAGGGAPVALDASGIGYREAMAVLDGTLSEARGRRRHRAQDGPLRQGPAHLVPRRPERGLAPPGGGGRSRRAGHEGASADRGRLTPPTPWASGPRRISAPLRPGDRTYVRNIRLRFGAGHATVGPAPTR